ncbi:MAG: hypothetical protein WA405_06440 [Candidatus Acidiferrales bacterium]
MENIKFRYLYRDAGNYKNWANVIFRNPDRLVLESVTKALQHTFLEECLFIAHQIRIPEAFLFAKGDATSDDHCFHEFDAVEITLDSPNDRHSRSITQFIADVKKEANRGWMAFDPHNIPSL